MAERNPYLILGIDFGASKKEARRYFAHAARRLRLQGGRWTQEDLTWALHEIESLEAHPADTVSIFRVPADHTAFDPVGDGMYRPTPVPLARRTEASSDAELAALRTGAAQSLVLGVLAAGGHRLDVSAIVYRFRQEDQIP